MAENGEKLVRACCDPSVDPGIFESNNQMKRAKAIGICRSCDLIRSCLLEALKLPRKEDTGVKAGLTENERHSRRGTPQSL